MANYSTDILSYYQGLSFDTPGNNQGDRVVIGDSSTFNFSDGVGSNNDYPFSIVADIYVRSFNDGFYILSKATGNPTTWSFVYYISSNNGMYLALYSGAGDQQRRREVEIPVNIVGKWIQVAVTYDGSMQPSGMKYYLDNEELTNVVLDDNRSYNGMQRNSSTPMIGVSAYGNPSYGGGADGMIGSLSVWDKVLTLSEIEEINKGIITEDNLVAYYPMNEGLGDIIYDHSSNQIDGVIHGATWTDKVGFKV